MTARRAACSCGQLHLAIEGEPSRISFCHCLACQRRTGAVIGNQRAFASTKSLFGGKSKQWMRTAESGNAVTYHFCPKLRPRPILGKRRLSWTSNRGYRQLRRPEFSAPTIAVWEQSRHPWVSLPPDTPPKRVARQG